MGSLDRATAVDPTGPHLYSRPPRSTALHRSSIAVFNLVKRAAQQVGAGLSLSDFDRVLDGLYSGQPSYTGKLVSPQTALAVSAIWSAVDIISSDLATLPLLTYYRTKQGRERATDHYLWSLLLDSANPSMTAWRFKRLMQAWVLLWGNAYAEIETNGRGQVMGLWPWRPDHVRITRDKDTGTLIYSYKLSDGRKVSLPSDRILHLRGLETDGVVGLLPIEVHRQNVGLNLAITEYGARYFGNNASPRGVLQSPQKLDDAAYERLKGDWAAQHQGLDNAHRVAILEEGMQWKDIGSNPVNAQLIESYNLTNMDVARIFRVPPHRLGLGNDNKSSIEEQSLEYVLYLLGTWTCNWESEVHQSLLSTRELERVYTKFNFLPLLRGNHQTLGDFISKMRQWGILNADEVREGFLDMNPQKGGVGKDYWTPVNMMPEGGDPRTAPQQMQKVKPAQPDDTTSNQPAGKPNGKPKPAPKPNGKPKSGNELLDYEIEVIPQ